MIVSDPGEKIEWGAEIKPRKNERVPSSECICLSAGAYSTTLYVMVDIMKGGQGWSNFDHDGMYSRKWQLPLCVH
jgi:hypothetical protein